MKEQAARAVLLIVNEEAHVRELARVAAALSETPDLRPVVFMEERMDGLRRPAHFTDRGVEVLTYAELATGETMQPRPFGAAYHRRAIARTLGSSYLARRMPGRVRNRLGLFGFSDAEAIRTVREAMLRRACVAERLLSSRDWASIVLCEDNVELDTAVWVSVARSRGVRCIIVPYTIANTREFAESYVNFAPYQVAASPQNRLAARWFPRWEKKYKGRRFLRTSYVRILAVEQLGLAPPNPWLLNSGYAHAIAVESQAMRDYYAAAGIPAAQMSITGSLADDVQAAAMAAAPGLRAELEARLALAPGRPILLCALPPDQNTYDRPGCEFSDFDDLVTFWSTRLGALEGWNVVVRPHPKTRPDQLGALSASGVAVCHDDTATLVPLCDLYVASVSATIRWAIACAKPVINYDVYRYGYDDYLGTEGVLLAETRAEFEALLDRMTRDTAQREQVVRAQRRDAPRWGMLDGHSGNRIVALLRGGQNC